TSPPPPLSILPYTTLFRSRIGHSRRVARAETAVNVLERFFLIVRRIFSKRLHDGVIVIDVDHFHLVNFKRHDLANGRQGKRFERSEEHTSELQSRVDLVCR